VCGACLAGTKGRGKIIFGQHGQRGNVVNPVDQIAAYPSKKPRIRDHHPGSVLVAVVRIDYPALPQSADLPKVLARQPAPQLPCDVGARP
jgi:hypothetical protein